MWSLSLLSQVWWTQASFSFGQIPILLQTWVSYGSWVGLDVIISDSPSMTAFEIAAQETFGKGKVKPALENQWIAQVDRT